MPVFCEKPVALDVPSTVEIVERVAGGDVPVQIGFQRRFDAGYRAAKAALESGELGWLHSLRAVTADQTPPPAAYIPTSGGLFRDCSIHDFDILLWLTGRQIVEVSAYGANKGDDFFTEGGDVDTVAAVCRFDDDTLATVSATRYNGAGHDVRLEVLRFQECTHRRPRRPRRPADRRGAHLLATGRRAVPDVHAALPRCLRRGTRRVRRRRGGTDVQPLHGRRRARRPLRRRGVPAVDGRGSPGPVRQPLTPAR